jgi:hypothetical protein
MRKLLMACLLVCATAYAAEPLFKAAVITASRTYERADSAITIAGMPAGSTTVSMSRVTVAQDGMLVTGEWEPKTTISATAKDFRRGTDVMAAIHRSRLLLRHPDGSVVSAKIVKREKQKEAGSERRGRSD